MADRYTTLLDMAKKAHALHMQAEGQEPEEGLHSAAGWALVLLALKAADYFLGQQVKDMIEGHEGDVEFSGAQAALDLFDDQPAAIGSKKGMEAALFKFMETVGAPDFPTARDAPVEGDPGAEAVLTMWARAQPDRGLPPEEVISRYGATRPEGQGPELGWCAGDRIAALKWCEAVVGGQDAPKPEAIAAMYLEDWHFDDGDDVMDLASNILDVGLVDVYDKENDLHSDDWTDEVWDQVTEWTRAAHRFDRGEDVEPLPLPQILLPTAEASIAVREFFDDGSIAEGGIHELIGIAPSYGTGLLVEALLACGSIQRNGTALEPTGNPVPAVQFLEAVAINIGSRLYAFDGLDAPEHATVSLLDGEDESGGLPWDKDTDSVDAKAGVDASEGVNANEEVAA